MAKPPHTRAEMRVLYPVCQVAELTAGYRYTTVYGWKINTAFVERLNLAIRQRVAAVGRRVNTLCQGEDGVLDQLALFQTYHNFVLPHASVRQPLLIPDVTNGRGPAEVWQPCTPAMP